LCIVERGRGLMDLIAYSRTYGHLASPSGSASGRLSHADVADPPDCSAAARRTRMLAPPLSTSGRPKPKHIPGRGEQPPCAASIRLRLLDLKHEVWLRALAIAGVERKGLNLELVLSEVFIRL